LAPCVAQATKIKKELNESVALTGRLDRMDRDMSAEIKGGLNLVTKSKELLGAKPWIADLVGRTEAAVKELMKKQEELRTVSAGTSSDDARKELVATYEAIIGSFKGGFKKDLQAVVR